MPFLGCLVQLDIQSDQGYDIAGFTANEQGLPRQQGFT